jgi:hypothetical protein
LGAEPRQDALDRLAAGDFQTGEAVSRDYLREEPPPRPPAAPVTGRQRKHATAMPKRRPRATTARAG